VRFNQLTVAIDETEKIRKRLLGQDSIGIVPGYLSLHLFNNYPEKEVKIYLNYPVFVQFFA
jgi:hypothetical protein